MRDKLGGRKMTMRPRLWLGLIILSVVTSSAQERIDLTTAETKPANTQYRIERLTLQFDDPTTVGIDEGLARIQLLGQNGEARSCIYNATTNPTGTVLLTGLNKANLSSAYTGAGTGSLKQRLFHRLAVMGDGAQVCSQALAGTVAGTVP